MKKLWTIFLLIFAVDSILYAQSSPYWTDTVITTGLNNSLKKGKFTPSSIQPVNITGNINALVVPVGFSDIQATQQFPTLANNTYFPVLGVDTTGTLLSDFINNYASSHNGALPPEDLWWEPAFNHYFRTESGGIFNVNFSFVKKSDGTRYQPNHPFSYFNNVESNDAEIVNEVGQKMYADDPTIFNNVHHLSFTFEGLTRSQFYNGYATGYTNPQIYTISGGSGQPSILYQGPITFQLEVNQIPHEFMHSIGAADGIQSTFWGFPDRGYDTQVADGSGDSHSNLNNVYDIMYHTGQDIAQHSLYGLMPLTSFDLMFLGWIQPSEILTVDASNFTNYSDIKLVDVNYPLTQKQITDGYYRVIKVIIQQNYDGQGHDEYFLVEYHNASEFDKNFENYDEYLTGGYNTGVLIWHIKEMRDLGLGTDNPMELEPAVPYNSWHGNPILNDSYPGHGNFNRPPLSQYGQLWWNGIYSGDFSYLDDNRIYPPTGSGGHFIYFPDGGRHIWETTLANDPNWTGYTSLEESGTAILPRQSSLRSDFFSNSNVNGYITNSITDATRPSTKYWGSYNSGNPIAAETHIAITNITRQNGYMTVRVYYNAYDGAITQNTTISGNATIAGNLTVNSGVTLTIASGATLNFLNGSSLTINGNLVAGITITIPAGITMTANPGATLNFAPNTGITVNGALNADGDTFTSNSTWNGIYFASGSSGTIQTCTIQNVQAYGGGAINISYASPTIEYCIIQNNTGVCDGVTVSNGSPFLFENTIRNNSRDGVYLYYSGALLLQNNITATSSTGNAAVYCDYYS